MLILEIEVFYHLPLRVFVPWLDVPDKSGNCCARGVREEDGRARRERRKQGWLSSEVSLRKKTNGPDQAIIIKTCWLVSQTPHSCAWWHFTCDHFLTFRQWRPCISMCFHFSYKAQCHPQIWHDAVQCFIQKNHLNVSKGTTCLCTFGIKARPNPVKTKFSSVVYLFCITHAINQYPAGIMCIWIKQCSSNRCRMIERQLSNKERSMLRYC